MQQSRRSLGPAKEEERRRLRNDLHDGLGPKLAALGLQLDAASTTVFVRPAEAVAVLATVKGDIRSTIDDIRLLVYDLRPPTLDELGLVGALRECAQRLEGAPGPLVTVSASKTLPRLSAATEVAVYRIGCEAMTNVVRHACARLCTVQLSIEDGQLVLDVYDNGVGRRGEGRTGVGTRSMYERAAEISGELTISDAHPGTRVVARLPIGAA